MAAVLHSPVSAIPFIRLSAHDAKNLPVRHPCRRRGHAHEKRVPKVLHQIAGLPMVAHVVKAAEAPGAGDLALVIGHGAEEMRKAAAKFAPEAEIFVQEKRLGTAHAVLAAREAMSGAMTIFW